MSKLTQEQRKHMFGLLIESCKEGKDGRWDVSTDEGKEGFDTMIDLLAELAADEFDSQK